MLALAQIELASGRINEGISILDKAYNLEPHPDIAFLYGKALNDRGREGDLDTAQKVLMPISLQDLPPDLRPALVVQAVQCLVKKKQWDEAETYLTGQLHLLDGIVLKTIRGYLFHYQGRTAEAELCASEARALISNDVPAESRDYLARLLVLIGRPADALPLWQGLFDSEPSTFDPANLLNCAAMLQRDDIILQACCRLHAKGVSDWKLVEFEVGYLAKYNINSAIHRLEQFLDQQPNHKLAMLRPSSIGLLLDRPNLVRASLADLPTVEELPLDCAVQAVQVMKFGVILAQPLTTPIGTCGGILVKLRHTRH
jgi:tetratricopeptide (TPR) repeat protein